MEVGATERLAGACRGSEGSGGKESKGFAFGPGIVYLIQLDLNSTFESVFPEMKWSSFLWSG
ncbi:MAG: hypothetical protein MUC41_02295 [Syntrophobacteraceae bacterium]|jgi:hypothetical protein|nr:hypothetical protein [Syntrophobacteraceae bacterium]